MQGDGMLTALTTFCAVIAAFLIAVVAYLAREYLWKLQ